MFRSTRLSFFSFFFFNDTATTEFYPLSLHDALPISVYLDKGYKKTQRWVEKYIILPHLFTDDLESIEINIKNKLYGWARSEEHTSELQSRFDLVCRLLLEKKKYSAITHHGGS